MSTISSLTSNQTYATSLITGTSSTSSSQSAADVAGLNSEDQAKISQGAKQMSELSQLASSDPTKFKEVAQKISDTLAEKAKNSSDSHESEMLTKMSEKFADAAKTGSMDSLKMERPSGQRGMNDAGTAAAKFAGAMHSGTNPMQTLESVVSDALNGVSTSSSDSSDTTTSSTAA